MSLEGWRDEILADAPHVLIYPGLLMDELSLQLAAQRLAPIQCNALGHPETSGLPTIDYFLSRDMMEPLDADKHYTERLVRLPNLSIYYEPLATSQATITRGELGVRPDAIVFWCGQSLYKYHPQYDFVFAKIAKFVGNCQFVFIKHAKETAVADLFHRRLDSVFSGWVSRLQTIACLSKVRPPIATSPPWALATSSSTASAGPVSIRLRRASSIICPL
jgi:protein O-GlcNAc transferase